jgi:hypothetical protein
MTVAGKTLARSARWVTALSIATLVGTSAGAIADAKEPRREAQELRQSRIREQHVRQELAKELRRRGVNVDWRLCSPHEMRDWKLRMDQAETLLKRHGIDADWRAYTLAEMQGWQRRIERTHELHRYGIQADWRLYTSTQLEELHAFLARSHGQPTVAVAQPAVIVPWRPVRVDADPDAVLAPVLLNEVVWGPNDDDSVLAPSLAERPWQGSERDDAVLPPTSFK